MGKLAASILAADLADLAEQVKVVADHADVIHVDVMDGHFVPALSIGSVVVASVRAHTERTVHGHLMVEAPEVVFDELASGGMDLVSFHVEAVDDPGPLIAKARGAGMRAGLAIAPGTPVERIRPLLDEVDDVIVMGVRPGRVGDPFGPQALPAIEAVRAELERRGLDADVEADGGIGLDTGRRCVDAGANVLVAGSSIFGAQDPAAAARDLKAIVGAA